MYKTIKIFLILISLIYLNSYSQKDNDARLFDAVIKCHKSEIKKLVEQGANVNAVDTTGGNVFMWAICKCDLDIVKYLVDIL